MAERQASGKEKMEPPNDIDGIGGEWEPSVGLQTTVAADGLI